MPLAAGQILQSRYRIIRHLGQGGMGLVYLAEHTQLAGRRFAIKENVPDPAAGAQVLAQRRQQFLTEAQVLAALDHQNLPKVSDFFTEGGNEYLVMDFVEGQNLEEALEQHLRQHGKPLPEKPVLIWADQVLDALECLHGQRPTPIIHRDVKPANIVLTPQGKAKLVDFGLVKLYDPSKPGTATAIQGFGTPQYTPLEQYGGGVQHTDARTDIYALGATLYHLLTGVAPPPVRDRLLDPTKLAPPRRLNPALSVTTESVLMKALEIQPDQRFQSAREMRQALVGTRLPRQPWRDPRAWAGMGGLFLLSILLSLAFLPGGFLNHNPRPTPTARGIPVVATPEPSRARETPSPIAPAPTPRSSSTATSMPLSASATPIDTPVPADLTATTVAAATGTIEVPTRIPTRIPTLNVTATAAPAPKPIWLSIPGGSFLMGSSDADIAMTLDECNATEGQKTGRSCERGWFNEPQRSVQVSGFEITKYEITNAQYKECGAAGVCAKAGRSVTDSDIRYDPGYFADTYPVVAVNWHDADAFCHWIGGRLPSEEEWEYAARGADGRRYPWGNTFNAARANLDSGFPAPVGSYPAGASPFRVLDMAGNVFEWTATRVSGNYVVRGGSWAKYYFRGRVADRGTQLDPLYASYDIGFRCIR